MRAIATAIAALGLLAMAIWAGGDSTGGAIDAGVAGPSEFAARIGPGGTAPATPAVSIAVVPVMPPAQASPAPVRHDRAAAREVWGRPAEFAPPED